MSTGTGRSESEDRRGIQMLPVPTLNSNAQASVFPSERKEGRACTSEGQKMELGGGERHPWEGVGEGVEKV